MKKEWMEPVVEVQEFTVNEYVAACGYSGKVYKFECNAGIKYSGNSNYHYKVWTEDGRLLTRRGYYGPCGATHEASVQDDFIKGYMDDVNTWENENIPVIIWTDGGTDVHCTKNLDINSWETAKS